jgi:hypothetical protein
LAGNLETNLNRNGSSGAVRSNNEPVREFIRADFPGLAHRHRGAATIGSSYSAESARFTESTALNNRLLHSDAERVVSLRS